MSRSIPSAVSLLLLAASSAWAQPVFIFNDADGDQQFTNGANWTPPEGFSGPPPTDGSAIIRHQVGANRLVLPDGTVDFDSLRIDNTNFYGGSLTLDSNSATSVGFTHGLKVTTFASSFNYRAFVYALKDVSIRLDSDQTWDVTYANIEGSIGGTGRLTFDPAASNLGGLNLGGANQFDGGLTVRDAYLTLQHPDALGGAGNFEFKNVTFDTYVDLNLNNAVTFGGQLGLYPFNTDGSFRFGGPITLDGSTSVTAYNNEGGPVSFAGAIGESTPSALVLTSGELTIGDSATTPTSTYTGGTTVNGGRLYFLNAEAVPATGVISSAENGYAGAAFGTGVQDVFVARLSATNFKGTIGLDTVPGPGLPNTFSNLDLSAVDADYFGIGSSTRATLSGTLNRGSTADYKFGGGGGTLFVQSALDDSTAGLLLHTRDDPLRLVLQGNNTFGGDITIHGGALVLDHPNALPAEAMVSTGTGTPSYFGATENSPLGLAELARGNTAAAENHSTRR